MKRIAKLSDQIEEEMKDAEGYMQDAMDDKEQYPSLAETEYTLSFEEMKHANMLHQQIVIMIEDYRKKHGEPPEKMIFYYEQEHKKHMRLATKIKVMQGLFKG